MLSSSVISDSLQSFGLQPARLLCPWDFFRQEYWNGLPFLPPGNIADPGIKPRSPVSFALQVDSLSTETLGKPYSSNQFTICKRIKSLCCTPWSHITLYVNYISIKLGEGGKIQNSKLSATETKIRRDTKDGFKLVELEKKHIQQTLKM